MSSLVIEAIDKGGGELKGITKIFGYVGHGIKSGHLRSKLFPNRADWRGFGQSVVDHLTSWWAADVVWRKNLQRPIFHPTFAAMVIPIPRVRSTGRWL